MTTGSKNIRRAPPTPSVSISNIVTNQQNKSRLRSFHRILICIHTQTTCYVLFVHGHEICIFLAVVTCPPLQEPANGYLVGSDGTPLNSTVGEKLLPSMDNVLYSGFDGTKDDSDTEWYPGDLVYYHCDSGYQVSDGNVSFCTGNGLWYPRNITCLGK